MQNWKIKRMKHEEVESNIKICNKFLHIYKKGKYIKEFYCLFCKIIWKFHPKCKYKCEYCVWEIFEGEECEDFSQRKFELQVADIKHDEKWREVRIPMLKRWKKILQAEKDNRIEGGR